MKTLCRLLLFVAAASAAVAEDQTFSVRTWNAPPGFLTAPGEDSATNGNSQDARAFLETSGVTFPEGSFARYLTAESKLTVRNTSDNLDIVEAIFNGWGSCIFPNPAVDIIALDCAFSSPAETAGVRWPTLEDVRKLPASDVNVLSQISVVAKSGLAISNQQSFFPVGEKGKTDPAPDDPDFQPGEFGAKLVVEPVAGPDGMTVELDYQYRLRHPISADTWSELNLTGSLLVRDNALRIFHVSPLGSDGRTLVLIAGVRLLDFDGLKTPLFWEVPTR